MNILVLGGSGYIGSVLCPYLIEKGHGVTVFDIAHNKSEDIRNVSVLIPALEKADVIVHLAGLPNDLSCEIDPKEAWEVNYKANDLIAKLTMGKKVIFASSCSVYGFGDGIFSEESTLNPQTLYAKTKLLSEKLFDAVILRFATVYGVSPKMRLDLVVNKMIQEAYTLKRIVVHGGDQWRPIVHVGDVALSIERGLTIDNGVYNVGSNAQNYQIKDIANIIQKELNVEVITQSTLDTRSYRVNFDKFNFPVLYTIAAAVKETHGRI